MWRRQVDQNKMVVVAVEELTKTQAAVPKVAQVMAKVVAVEKEQGGKNETIRTDSPYTCIA